MVDAELLVPGAIIEHERTGRYTVLSNTLKLRNREGSWFDAVRYRNDKGEEFVRVAFDFSSFTLVEAASDVWASDTLRDLNTLYHKLLNGTYYQDYDEDMRLLGVLRPLAEAVPVSIADLDITTARWQGFYDHSVADDKELDRAEYAKVLSTLHAYRNLLVWRHQAEGILRRCLPIVQYDAQMMADITRHAPLAPEDQAKHDHTEYDSEKLVREIPLLLINEYEASPEFQLEQPHPTADERAACDEIVAAACRAALSLIVCPQASAWTPTAEQWPEHGQTVIKRWGEPGFATVSRVEQYDAKAKESFTAWAPLPPNGPQRVPVLAAVMRYHDEVQYLPLARLLNGSEWLGQPVLDAPYITADNRSVRGDQQS